RRVDPVTPFRAGGFLPPEGRPQRARGDAPTLHRAGGQPARLSRAGAISRVGRRAADRGRRRPGSARSAGAVLSAQAALAVRLPAARDELRELWGGGGPRRLLASRR